MSIETNRFLQKEIEPSKKPLQLPSGVQYKEPDYMHNITHKLTEPSDQAFLPITKLPEQIRIALITTPDRKKIHPTGDLLGDKPEIVIQDTGEVIINGTSYYLSSVIYTDTLEKYMDETNTTVDARIAQITLSDNRQDVVVITNRTKMDEILEQHFTSMLR